MFTKRIVGAALLVMSTQVLNAEEIVAEWTYQGDSDADYTFHLDLQPTDLDQTYTLNGYMVYDGSMNREAVTGSATYSPNEAVYVVSLFFNSSTGETFSIGANVDPTTLSGDGTLIRVAHGSVGSDRDGTLAAIP